MLYSSDLASSTLTVLCVDDESHVLKSMTRLLRAEPVHLLVAESGAEALALLKNHKVHVVVSDMRMPHLSGAEFLAQVASLYPHTYRIVLTGYADLESSMAAVNEGKVHRFMQKPWQNDELIVAIKQGLEHAYLLEKNAELQQHLNERNAELETFNKLLEQKVEERTGLLKKFISQLKFQNRQIDYEHRATLKILSNVIGSSPLLDGVYAHNVSQLCAKIATELSLSEVDIEVCTLAGLLSEIGLLALPVELVKKPFYQMDLHEKHQYQQHPHFAQMMMAPAMHLQAVIDSIAHQYERFNGTGVPDQLIGADIPLGARILAVARDFWGYRLQRIHKEKMSRTNALQQLKLHFGGYYDPDVVQVLEKLIHTLDDVLIMQGGDTVSTAQLKPGMVLKHPLYNQNKIMLLTEGHRFTANSILKIRQLEKRSERPLLIHIECAETLMDIDEVKLEREH